MKGILLTILILTLILPGCKYCKPLFVFKKSINNSVDSIGQKEAIKSWSFPCLRTGLHRGYYSITKIYNTHNRLVQLTKRKNTWIEVSDGGDEYSKTIILDTLGRIHTVEYFIAAGWMIALQRTDYYSGNRLDSIVETKAGKRQVIIK